MSTMGDRTVKIGLVQTTVSGDVHENLARSLILVRQAAEAGAAIICLPELFRTPYFPSMQGEMPQRLQNHFLAHRPMPLQPLQGSTAYRSSSLFMKGIAMAGSTTPQQ